MEMIHHHFESLSSTNDWAKLKLSTFPRDKITLVTADLQTKGRGQFGKKWVSPRGENLIVSYCFFVDTERSNALSLTHVLALSVAHVLELHGILCQIKWPNDLLVSGKKIAGILCETENLAPLMGVVIGLGLNINMTEENLQMVGQPATSLRQESGKEWEVKHLLNDISDAFLKDLDLYLQKGFAPFLSAFEAHSLKTPTNPTLA